MSDTKAMYHHLFLGLAISLLTAQPTQAQLVLRHPPPVRRNSLTALGVLVSPIFGGGPGFGLSQEHWFVPHLTGGFRAIRGSIPRRQYATDWADAGLFGRYYVARGRPRGLFAEVSGRGGREWDKADRNVRTPELYAAFDGAIGYRFTCSQWATPVLDVGANAGLAWSRISGRWWAENTTFRPLIHIGMAF